MAFAMPVNYDTDQYDASATYATRVFQGSLQYTFSHFVDNLRFVSLPYPTSNTSAPYQQTAAYSAPPSNDAHYVTVMLASNVLPQTRVNLNARVGLELQNDAFAPNTSDSHPVLAGVLNPNGQGSTANSLDASATVYQIKASVASHPAAGVDTRISYGVDGRSVSLDQVQGQYGTVGRLSGRRDATSQQPAIRRSAELAEAYAGFELGYRVLPQSDTKLTVGYRFDSVDRTNAAVEHSTTNSFTVAARSQLGPLVDGSLSLEYADRSAALNYLTPWQSLAGPTLASPVYSGSYYQAPMTFRSSQSSGRLHAVGTPLRRS